MVSRKTNLNFTFSARVLDINIPKIAKSITPATWMSTDLAKRTQMCRANRGLKQKTQSILPSLRLKPNPKSAGRSSSGLAAQMILPRATQAPCRRHHGEIVIRLCDEKCACVCVGEACNNRPWEPDPGCDMLYLLIGLQKHTCPKNIYCVLLLAG